MKDKQEILVHRKMCHEQGIPQYTVKILVLWRDKIFVLKKDSKHAELVGGLNGPEDENSVIRTAQRKLKAEMGLSLTPEKFEFLWMRKERKTAHTFYLYRVYITEDDLKDFAPAENGGVATAYAVADVLNVKARLPKSHIEIINRYFGTQ